MYSESKIKLSTYFMNLRPISFNNMLRQLALL